MLTAATPHATRSSRAPLAFSSRNLLPVSDLWQIHSGFVRTLTSSEEGHTLTLGIWGAGDVVGAALSTLQPYRIECLTPVQAVPMALAALPNPIETLLEHLHLAEELMQIRSHKRIEIMLLNLLNWLAQRFGQETGSGRLIDLRLTHQDLSELLGTTRVTVTRALIQMEQQGLIQRLTLQRIVLQQAECWHYEI